MTKRNPFASRGSKTVELIADRRSPLERLIAEYELAGMIGLTRPQMYGPRTESVMQEIIRSIGPLPWSIEL